ncbi:hypothetical protein LOZ12_003416 [Ophidiomyces ophidiicola]|uniref:Uncharacterized protein n=1 Tax=Ophidiomyces ophidiicola TaxID=1387563 RepID=A0ACB8UV15_9EURO|nr:uncharacterized protein LOZ57_003998 [Ophidiomyces ophidiicola]KAI1945747.1 hypothetical protein LOZ57_003998 [Ophidiomyces ophidiicola]KAI1950665.1 hypothetical protein LOZ62_001930 [Ophidiomyces ophidiicola]KAI1972628.1 hypothetical protein LOZ56_002338 [Ophidiomyces ophidiicola]KAI2006621.1 hypothetical protein LOZ50_003006 [Ophidiomyces ophidiicola]KAI2018332.1 hypothetical protein LOZ46_003920 [Ophidiomyces ophidiicola]
MPPVNRIAIPATSCERGNDSRCSHRHAARLYKPSAEGDHILLSYCSILTDDTKTDSARSALSSFTCTLCNKSYSRHPEYEAHISSYDHQHTKRLRDLKQLSRDPNAAERARRAERKADAEAGLVVVDTAHPVSTGGAKGNTGGGGFKKGGFKSSFAVVSTGVSSGTGGGGATTTGPGLARKNVLGDDDDESIPTPAISSRSKEEKSSKESNAVESDTDDDYGGDDLKAEGGYYDPRKPTGCFVGCKGLRSVSVE